MRRTVCQQRLAFIMPDLANDAHMQVVDNRDMLVVRVRPVVSRTTAAVPRRPGRDGAAGDEAASCPGGEGPAPASAGDPPAPRKVRGQQLPHQQATTERLWMVPRVMEDVVVTTNSGHDQGEKTYRAGEMISVCRMLQA